MYVSLTPSYLVHNICMSICLIAQYINSQILTTAAGRPTTNGESDTKQNTTFIWRTVCIDADQYSLISRTNTEFSTKPLVNQRLFQCQNQECYVHQCAVCYGQGFFCLFLDYQLFIEGCSRVLSQSKQHHSFLFVNVTFKSIRPKY